MIAKLRHGPGPGLLLFSLLLCGIWGSTWLVIREGLRDLPPLHAATLRFLVASAILILLAPPLARIEGGERPTAGLTAIHAFLILALPYGVIYWVETVLPSGLVSVLWSIYPILTALIAGLLLPAERLGARQWLGLALGFLGVGLMFVTDVAAIGPGALPAALLLLVSPASTATGNVLLKRLGAGTSSALLNRNGMLAGAATLGVAALLIEGRRELHWTPAAVFSVAYLALVGTVVAFGVYFWLLRHARATRLALISYAIPVIALTLGGTVGNEPVGLHTVGGVVLVLSGVSLVMVRGRRAEGTSRPENPDSLKSGVLRRRS